MRQPLLIVEQELGILHHTSLQTTPYFNSETLPLATESSLYDLTRTVPFKSFFSFLQRRRKYFCLESSLKRKIYSFFLQYWARARIQFSIQWKRVILNKDSFHNFQSCLTLQSEVESTRGKREAKPSRSEREAYVFTNTSIPLPGAGARKIQLSVGVGIRKQIIFFIGFYSRGMEQRFTGTKRIADSQHR